MEIAFSPTTIGVTSADLVELAVEAEGLGYSAAWLAEVSGPEAFALSGAIAQATRDLEVGVAVVPAVTRSPALLAMGSATVSSLLRGRRFRLGIGASSEFIVTSWHDREFGPPLGRVRDALLATRALLDGESSVDRRFASVDRFRLGERPAGPVLLHVGALGPRMLELAGAIADGVCLNLMTPEAAVRQRAHLERGAADAGRRLGDDFQVMARFHVILTDDVAAGHEVIRKAFGPYFAQPVYNRFLAWMGFTSEAEALRAAFAQGDRAGVSSALHGDLIDQIALIGPPGRIRQRLAQYDAAGVGVAALGLLGADASAVREALVALAPGG